MEKLLFDLETDGLWGAYSQVHCGWVANLDTGERTGYRSDRGNELEEMARRLEEAELLVGHNIGEFDIPVLEDLFDLTYDGDIIDTLCCSWMIHYGDLRARDMRRWKKGLHPGQLINAHSLEAWGHRLGVHKIAFHGPWDTLTDEMYAYGEGDVILNVKLYEHLLQQGWSYESMVVESNAARVLARQHHHGVCFDVEGAIALQRELVPEKAALERKLQEEFPPRWRAKGKDGGLWAPKRKNGPKGWGAGDPMTKIELLEFNPGSDQHIVEWLGAKYGWKPIHFTKKGNPRMTEQVIEEMPYPEASTLLRWKLLDKRLQQLDQGDNAWLNLVTEDGRLHGRVKSTGTITTRMAHSRPNLGQVPKVGQPYGKECRALFKPQEGWVMVGADASGLQMRLLAHHLARWDGGEFAKQVVEGDVHEYFRQGTGLLLRNTQKTWSYAWLFGAQEHKLGTIVIQDRIDARELGEFDGPIPSLRNARKLGKRSVDRLKKLLPSIGAMDDSLAKAVKRGWMTSYDGCRLPIRHAHAALNTALQGGEARVMKRALDIFDRSLRLENGLIPEKDFEFVLNIHDEWQLEARPECSEVVGQLAVEAIRKAGQSFNLRVQLDGEYKIGANWAETH